MQTRNTPVDITQPWSATPFTLQEEVDFNEAWLTCIHYGRVKVGSDVSPADNMKVILETLSNKNGDWKRNLEYNLPGRSKKYKRLWFMINELTNNRQPKYLNASDSSSIKDSPSKLDVSFIQDTPQGDQTTMNTDHKTTLPIGESNLGPIQPSSLISSRTEANEDMEIIMDALTPQTPKQATQSEDLTQSDQIKDTQPKNVVEHEFNPHGRELQAQFLIAQQFQQNYADPCLVHEYHKAYQYHLEQAQRYKALLDACYMQMTAPPTAPMFNYGPNMNDLMKKELDDKKKDL